MGVHGLQSWVYSQSSLATTVALSPSDPFTSSTPPIPLVVDGLAFLYQTALDDTLRGGNYFKYAQTVKRYAEYWRAVGLEPVFVWDGPFGSSKASTVLQRSEQNLRKSVKYFRASDEQRAAPFMQKLAKRLPPLTFSACVAELRVLGVKFYVAEGEADSPTAELSQRLNGYMASNDSDYFIFNSCCRGYIPLHTMEYGFRNSQHLSTHDWPTAAPSLRFRVFHHSSIANLLSLPPSFLPILACLIGNDLVDYASKFAAPGHPAPAYSGQMTALTINRIGRALATHKHLPAESLVDIRHILLQVLPQLLSNNPLDIDMVNNLSLAAQSYSLHSLDTPLPTFPLHPSPSDVSAQTANKEKYMTAFKDARLGATTLVILSHGICNTSGSVDNPAFVSPAVTFGRSIRIWLYAVLRATIGIGRNFIVEYDRRGDTVRATATLVESLPSLLQHTSIPVFSPQLLLDQASSIRIAIYCHAIHIPPSQPLPPLSFLPLVLALRHIQSLTKRPWDIHTLTAALLAAILVSPSSPLDVPSLLPLYKSVPQVPKKDHIQSSAELVQTLLHLQLLAEVLLLTEVLPSVHTLFEGALFHFLLETDVETLVRNLGETELVEQLLRAVVG